MTKIIDFRLFMVGFQKNWLYLPYKIKSTMVRILISIGSNIYSKQNIDKAKRMIAFYFLDVIFTDSIISISTDENCVFPFRNILGTFNTELAPDEIIQKLKSIESALGRLPKDKELGRVIIDIDLIQYGDEILRPEDYEKNYVQELLGQLTDKL